MTLAVAAKLSLTSFEPVQAMGFINSEDNSSASETTGKFH